MLHPFSVDCATHILDIYIYYWTDQDRSNNCKFFCQLEAWQGLASACDLTVPNIAQPSADLPIDQLYAATLNAAQTAETAWVSGASAAIDNLVAPTRSRELLILIDLKTFDFGRVA